MKIVALCKTFRGEEFLEFMFKSIESSIEHIIFVNSEESWTGRKGNTCKPVIEKLSKNSDKIITLNIDTSNQKHQCLSGFTYIKHNFKCDYVMLIDTDEVWDEYNLKEAVKYLERNDDPSLVYKAGIHTYIKSPFYRVCPQEPLRPVVFVSSKREDLGLYERCYGLKDTLMKTEKNELINFHHFVYVRKNFNIVLEKILSSHVSENSEYCDMSKWIPEVWNNLPYLIEEWRDGFHPSLGFKKHWKDLQTVGLKDLPEVFKPVNILEERGLAL